ncbi:MAG: hypothetical protein ACLP7I_16055 [Limisphaerales bacterium]
MATKTGGPNHNLRYTILFGDGNGDMPEWATRGDAPKGDTKTASCSPMGIVVTPIEATPRVAPKGDVSNPIGVKTISKGKASPQVSQKFFPSELDKAIADQHGAIKRTPSDDIATSDALWEKLHELETLKFGHAITARKPSTPKNTPQLSQPKGAINFWNLPEGKRKSLTAQLHAARENPPAPAPDSDQP